MTAYPAAVPAAVAERPGPGPALWCAGVRKRYGRRQALDGVGLEVARGEVLGLLGPNGAGKTSLIKILLGLVRADAGEVMLLGRPGGPPSSRRGVGYLPELFRFHPWLTADEVVRLHCRLTRTAWSSGRRRAALERVGLGARAGDRVGGFSKGMQQRLGLAVAMVGDPELVVLDEPTSALDPLGRADVRSIVESLRAGGCAVVLNSHLIGEVERVCDRVVILDHGRVAAAGSLEELLGRRQVRLRLEGVDDASAALLAGAGQVERLGEWFTVTLADGPADRPGSVPDSDPVPDLVAGLVARGVRVYAVEPARISLETRLLGILRAGATAADPGAAGEPRASGEAG